MDDLFLMYAAHMQELDDAVDAVLSGEEPELTFEMTDFDRDYIDQEVSRRLGTF